MSGLLVESPPSGCRIAFCAATEGARLDRQPLGAWLTPGEIAQWRSLASEKRRRDWLCGRIAAKKALGNATQVEILNEASGRPYARRLSGEPAPPLSISHCSQGGACAVSGNGQAVGVDYETVAPREERVLELYLHPDERAAARSCADLTALWSLKEAVLKLLGLGLGGGMPDARFLSLEGSPEPDLFGAARKRWEELGKPRLQTSWRLDGDAVLALAWSLGG